jgi:hypothetical protein
VNIHRIVQNALLGQVPSTLRFVYAQLENDTLHFKACFAEDATEEHLDAVSVAVAEIVADLDSSIELSESIEVNGKVSWKTGSNSDLMYLRYGELSAI